MINEELHTSQESFIQFNLNVVATDLPMSDPNFKIKLVLDFVPEFTSRTLMPQQSNFNGNRVHEILNFVADKVTKKVIEYVYFDRSNKIGADDSCKDNRLADGFDKALEIYNKRLEIKACRESLDDTSYADYREQREDENDEGYFIQEIVDNFFFKEGRMIDAKEMNVTRITYEHLSPPTLTLESKTAINGDKKLPK
jgi:hypothetical protein